MFRNSIQLPDGRITNKRFSHHGLTEIKNGTPHVRVFVAKPSHLEPYAYSLGMGHRFFRTGFELEKNSINLRWQRG
jgi:hypothetical protein